CATDCTTDADLDGTIYCADTCLDADGDGYGDAGGAGNSCTAADCDDAVDTCTTDCTTDVDLDGTTDCADTCLDADGDGYGDGGGAGNSCAAADCDDSILEVWATPGEVRDLVFLADKMTLSWTAPVEPGATTVVYDTIRSAEPADFITSADCVESNDGADTMATDPEVPLTNSLFAYLVRAENDCPTSQGPLGTDSAGSDRQGRACDGPECTPNGSSCIEDTDCCSNKCNGPQGGKTCRP
ncbi:MAG: hypothetical protein JSV65_14035, partial [Armatimonadota bacterium]